MQKVYLLLRDNKQTGPYSLDEIVQLGLKPFDLVWVEGRSCGWSYPAEINALKPYVPEAPASVQPKASESTLSTPNTYTPADSTTSSSPKDMAPPKSVFVSLPGKGAPTAPPTQAVPVNDWDRRVDELRQRAQAATHQPVPAEETPSLDTHYARSLDEVEDQYTNWVFQQKVKKKPALFGRQVAALAVVVLLAGGGYLVATSRPGGKQQHTEAVLTIPQASKGDAPLIDMPTEETARTYEEQASPQEPAALTVQPAKKVKKLVAAHTAGVSTRKPAASLPEAEQKPTPQQPVTERAVATAPADQKPALPAEKKKTLADKIDGFIDKIASKGRSGAQKEAVEDAPRTGPAPGTGERRSTRRGKEGAPSINEAELARQVDVVVGNSDNWMMGVKDLKLILRNNSPVTVKRAAVEVSYYTESDNLLDKKTVIVTNIPAGGRKTIAAPDQRMADHVEVKLLSASADDEAYAQQ